MVVSQIDGSTLRTLCMQHGPLITFHLNLTQGSAVVRYSSKDEAAKAQKSLHMYVLEPSEGLSCFCDALHPLVFGFFSVVFIQVRSREHNHPGRVRRGGGSKSLLCTRPVARRHDQLAGHSRHQSDQDGQRQLWSIPPDRSLIPLEQQQQWQQQQQQQRRSKDRRGAAVGWRAAVFQPVEAPKFRGGTGHGQSHPNQYAAARGPAEWGVDVGWKLDNRRHGKAKTFEIIVEIIIVGMSEKRRRGGGRGFILTTHPRQPPTLCFC